MRLTTADRESRKGLLLLPMLDWIFVIKVGSFQLNIAWVSGGTIMNSLAFLFVNIAFLNSKKSLLLVKQL